MHRIAPAALLLALAACTVERTPDEYLDPRDPAEVEIRETEGELAARVGAFREALARQDRDAAVAALIPEGTTHVIGPGENAGIARFGPAGLREALNEVVVPAGAIARTPDLRVEADPRDGVGWFATHLEMLPVVAEGRASRLRMTGVFLRHEGEWRIAQVHLSTPPPADSVTPPPSPAAGGAPPAGG